MTLIIRSDKTATRSLGNAYGFRGPADWVLKLDFQNQEYRALVNGSRQNVDVETYLTCGRISSAAYFDTLGRRAIAEPQRLRIGSLKAGGPTGLLSEGVRRNVFNNPMAPASHVATLLFMPNNPVIVLSCEGPAGASVTLTGDITEAPGGTTSGHSITATPGQPAFAHPVANKASWQFVYMVTGAVTEVGAWSMSATAAECSPAVPGQLLGGTLNDEVLHVNVTELGRLTSLSAGTLVACVDAAVIGRTGINTSRIILHLGDGTSEKYAGIGMATATSGNPVGRRITSRRRSGGINTEVAFTPPDPFNSKMCAAIGWNAAQANVAASGSTTTDSAMDALLPTHISVGGGWEGGWVAHPGSALFGVISALLYFPRKLSAAEISEVARSRL